MALEKIIEMGGDGGTCCKARSIMTKTKTEKKKKDVRNLCFYQTNHQHLSESMKSTRNGRSAQSQANRSQSR